MLAAPVNYQSKRSNKLAAPVTRAVAIKIYRGSESQKAWTLHSTSTQLLDPLSTLARASLLKRWGKNATECPARAARINSCSRQRSCGCRSAWRRQLLQARVDRTEEQSTTEPTIPEAAAAPGEEPPPPATGAAPPAAEVGITLMLATFVTRWPHHHNYSPPPTGHQPPRRRHRAAPCHRPPLHSYPATKPPPNHHAPTLAAHKQIRSQHTGAALYAWTIAGIAHTRHRHHAS